MTASRDSNMDGQRQPAVAFDEVYARYCRPVFSFVSYRIADRQAAEDITATVFEKAWRSLRSFDPERASVSSWLFTIARNCVFDHLRRGRRNREEAVAEIIQADTAAGPELQLEDKERRHELMASLAHLEEREREVIALKFGGGMSNGDIAAVMSLTPTNVSTILYRSLARLKTQLEGGINND
ncbi:MAG: RNA polymerase sigma factor [Thermoleophilia bacterium]